MSLATKYRPKTFDDVCGQNIIKKILKQQLATHQLSNCYLFSGNTGCGKTTLARIFAHEINNYACEPIEIDAASNNGVDNIRQLIDDSYVRNMVGTYKVVILDEVHMLTIQSWNALLKIVEEPPEYTIFIFCTTDAQKIPETILNRALRFNLNKISISDISNRLKYICEQEHCINYINTCELIAKQSDGKLRNAISLLEKCILSSGDSLNLDNINISDFLDNVSYDTLIDIVNMIIDGEKEEVNLTNKINLLFEKGIDAKKLTSKLYSFLVDLNLYCITNNFNILNLPTSYKNSIDYVVGGPDNKEYFYAFANKIFDLLNCTFLDNNVLLMKLIGMQRGI